MARSLAAAEGCYFHFVFPVRCIAVIALTQGLMIVVHLRAGFKCTSERP
jgi:hypothetical protein